MHDVDYWLMTEKVIMLSVSVAQFIEKESIPFSINDVQTKNKFDFISYVDKEAEKLTGSFLMPVSGTSHCLIIKYPSAGKYSLIINQDTIDSFSGRQLSEGINLANYSKTPLFKQATKVQQLSWERNELVASKLRLLALFDFSDLINCNSSTSIEAIKELREKRIESVNGKPCYNYFKSSVEQCIETRPF